MKFEYKADVASILARFPKTRPALPPKMRELYAEHYKENRSGRTPASAATQRVERWLHRQVASDVADGRALSTLELGAGTLNQLAFEPDTSPYDIVEPFESLYEDAPARGRVRQVFADVGDVPLDRRYQRITSVAALEHVCDLPFVLARAGRLLGEGGVMRAAIPSEGGFLWRLGWSLTTGLEFRLRYGLDYGDLMRHEHVNQAWEVEALVSALFEDVQVRALGFGRQLSLYRFVAARRPRLDLALEWERSSRAGVGAVESAPPKPSLIARGA